MMQVSRVLENKKLAACLLTVLSLTGVFAQQSRFEENVAFQRPAAESRATDMVLDGKFLTADEVLELQMSDPYRDNVRFYVIDRHSQAEGLMYGFTSLERFNEYLTATDREAIKPEYATMSYRPASGETESPVRRKSSAAILYFDNTNFVGPTGILSSGTARCFTNSDIWFNNRIESIMTMVCDCSWTIARDHCAPGVSLWIEGGTDVADLGIGWRNYITHIQVL